MAAESNNWLVFAIIMLLIAFAAYGISARGPTQTQASAPTPAHKQMPAPVIEMTVKQISIDADSTGFYLNGEKTTTLNVDKDSYVTLSIHVSPNIGYYGLIFRSPRFPDLKINAGETGVVEFNSIGEFEITSYKPATTTTKAESVLAVLRVIGE